MFAICHLKDKCFDPSWGTIRCAILLVQMAKVGEKRASEGGVEKIKLMKSVRFERDWKWPCNKLHWCACFADFCCSPYRRDALLCSLGIWRGVKYERKTILPFPNRILKNKCKFVRASISMGCWKKRTLESYLSLDGYVVWQDKIAFISTPLRFGYFLLLY